MALGQKLMPRSKNAFQSLLPINVLFYPELCMLCVLHIHLENMTSKSKYANINDTYIISEYIK